MAERRPSHPSGRPIRRNDVKTLGFTRRPFDGPLPPGLQKDRQTYAVGFTARIAMTDDDE